MFYFSIKKDLCDIHIHIHINDKFKCVCVTAHLQQPGDGLRGKGGPEVPEDLPDEAAGEVQRDLRLAVVAPEEGLNDRQEQRQGTQAAVAEKDGSDERMWKKYSLVQRKQYHHWQTGLLVDKLCRWMKGAFEFFSK